ncbi:MAG: response regulator transcription factor [Novosphingobium sp.]|nr:response regulator transcription factor [Novosphingobium sp.]
MDVGADIKRLEKLAARAALQPLHLPELLAQVSRMIGAEMSTVELFDKNTGELVSIVTDRPDIMTETGAQFESHYAHINPRLPHVLAGSLGEFVNDDAIGSDAELMRYEFYSDFLAPSDMRYFAASKIIDDSSLCGLVSAQIAPRFGRPGERLADIWRAIVPHVGNAVAINAGFMRQPMAREFGDVLDSLASPLAILSDSGRVLFANRSMGRLIARGGVLNVQDGELRAVDPAMENGLNSVLRRIQAGSQTASAAIGQNLGETAIWRAVRLSPPQAMDLGMSGSASICVILDVPLSLEPSSTAMLERELGLTWREAQVGLLLADGEDIDAIAARLGRSRNTIRSHAASLRDKLGVTTSIAAAAMIRRFSQQVLLAEPRENRPGG